MILNSGICPICRGEMEKSKKHPYSTIFCKNHCYAFSHRGDRKVIMVFNDSWQTHEEFDLKTKLEIYKIIKYWKNNDRYLMKIME